MSNRSSRVDPESFVRDAYSIAERMDLEGWKALFADNGIFTDESVGITYRGPNEWDYPVRNSGTAFADMHRGLYDLWTVGENRHRPAGSPGHPYWPARDSVRNHPPNG
jgi:hypothetical protein